jgi:hypothetical protein
VAKPWINLMSLCACVLELLFLVLFRVVARSMFCVGVDVNLGVESLHSTPLHMW